ncbi:MAG: type II toxin-antitoxin system YhaV family toxin [Gemmatimonadales bacterium]
MSSDRARGRGRRPQAADPFPVVQGWTLAFHPCLLDQVERLVVAAEGEVKRAGRSGANWPGPNQKLLAHGFDLMFEAIPRDPNASEYRLGRTLGREQAHWRRGKTGGGRYRLFFRFRSDARLIVFAWINDEESLRTYGSATDAYGVFADRLARGAPPDDRDALAAEAGTAAARQRAARLRSRGQ